MQHLYKNIFQLAVEYDPHHNEIISRCEEFDLSADSKIPAGEGAMCADGIVYGECKCTQ